VKIDVFTVHGFSLSCYLDVSGFDKQLLVTFGGAVGRSK